jgi:hypothetical protein
MADPKQEETFTVKNRTQSPVMLESGVTIAASGTKGSEKTDIVLSERDRKLYVDTEKLSAKPSSAPPSTTPPAATSITKATGESNKSDSQQPAGSSSKTK